MNASWCSRNINYFGDHAENQLFGHGITPPSYRHSCFLRCAKKKKISSASNCPPNEEAPMNVHLLNFFCIVPIYCAPSPLADFKFLMGEKEVIPESYESILGGRSLGSNQWGEQGARQNTETLFAHVFKNILYVLKR